MTFEHNWREIMDRDHAILRFLNGGPAAARVIAEGIDVSYRKAYASLERLEWEGKVKRQLAPPRSGARVWWALPGSF